MQLEMALQSLSNVKEISVALNENGGPNFSLRDLSAAQPLSGSGEQSLASCGKMSCISRRVTNVAERNANCCSRQQSQSFLSATLKVQKIKRVSVPSSASSSFADFLSIWIHS